MFCANLAKANDALSHSQLVTPKYSDKVNFTRSNTRSNTEIVKVFTTSNAKACPNVKNLKKLNNEWRCDTYEALIKLESMIIQLWTIQTSYDIEN